MRSQIEKVCGEKTKTKKKKRWSEEEGQNRKMKTLKQCANSDTTSSWRWCWSDLQIDMLKEIKMKLSYVDYVRFRGVCRNWRKIEDDKGDDELFLPWLCTPVLDLFNNFSYRLFEPPLASTNYRVCRDEVTIQSSLPLNLNDCYGDDILVSHLNQILTCLYIDGWLYMIANGSRSNNNYFLLFNIATKASFTLPCFNHPFTGPDSVFLGVSSTPDSRDCVFFALFQTDEYTRTIAIFRQGRDTEWTRIEFSIADPDGRVVDGAVFLRRVFCFHISALEIAYYDLDTNQILKLAHFSPPFEFIDEYIPPILYELDGELILTYHDKQSLKFCIWKHDWSNKVWSPLVSLGARSLYLTCHSLYVVPINYNNRVSSARSKIYVHDGAQLEIVEYTLEDNQVLQRNSTFCWGLDNYYCKDSYPPCAVWVDPPDVLLKFGDRR